MMASALWFIGGLISGPALFALFLVFLKTRRKDLGQHVAAATGRQATLADRLRKARCRLAKIASLENMNSITMARKIANKAIREIDNA